MIITKKAFFLSTNTIYNLGTIPVTIDYHALPFLPNMCLANFPPETYFQVTKRNNREVGHKYIHAYICTYTTDFGRGPSNTVKTNENSEENSVCEDDNSQGKQMICW